jgi:hypothetical protein
MGSTLSHIEITQDAENYRKYILGPKELQLRSTKSFGRDSVHTERFESYGFGKI